MGRAARSCLIPGRSVALGILAASLQCGCRESESLWTSPAASPLPAAAPAVSSVSPGSGPDTGGTAVTLTGTGFQTGAAVFVGSSPAGSVSSVGTTQILAVTPAGAPGPAPVTVQNPDGGTATLAGGFVFFGPPAASAVSPGAGTRLGGTVVTVAGSGFLAGATISFGGAAGTVLAVSGASLTARTPPGTAGPASVTVTNPDGRSSTLAGGFLYTRVLVLSGIVPERGPVSGGTSVTLTGLDFVAGSTLTIGTAAASVISVLSTTTLTATTAAGVLGPASVTVTNPDGQEAMLETGFTLVGPAPSIASVSPSGGPPWGGAPVTIAGADFAGGAAVSFGGAASPSVAVVSTTQVVAVSPPGAPGTTVAVTVTNLDGSSASAAGAHAYAAPSDSAAPSFSGVASATAVSPFAVELRWSAASDATSPSPALRYAVYGATVSGGQAFSIPPWYVTDPGETTFVAGGLEPSRTYHFVVRARDASGNEETNAAESSAATPAAGSPAWALLPAPAAAREGPVAALLPDGRLLIGGGRGASGPLATCEVYDPRSGAWAQTGAMGIARERAASAILPDGRVLVLGGENGSGRLSSCERYDPAGGTWSAVGSLGTARASPAAVRLPDGRVLACGGTGPAGAPLAGAEIYDPASGAWTATGTMAAARDAHGAVALGDGRVLVAGGSSGTGALSSAEVYDPASATWSGGGSLSTARSGASLTRLPDGRVLAAGGRAGSVPTAGCEVYDPGAGTWSATGALTAARYDHRATLLARGRVLVTGGTDGSTFPSTAEAYDPFVGTWRAAGTLASGRARHAAVLLHGGRLVVVGGTGAAGPVSSAERHDPMAGAGTWRAAGSPGAPRYRPLTATLPDGRVLAMGGLRWPDPGGYVYHATAELYDPAAGTWTATASPASARYDGVGVLLPDGRFLVAGGTSAFSTTSSVYPTSAETYDPSAGTWTSAGSLALGREDPVAALLPGGRVLVAGGRSAIQTALSSCETFDPATGTWTWAGSMGAARVSPSAALLPSGKVLVLAGVTNTFTLGVTGSAEVRDPVSGAFATTGALAAGRWSSVGVTLPSGRTLVAGGHGASAPLAACEVRDPASGAWAPAGALASARMDPAAALLPDGDLLVAGGMAVWSSSVPPLASAEVYDPGAGSWTATRAMASGRHAFSLVSLADGSVLAVGGRSDVTTCERFDEGRGPAGSWRPALASVAGSSAFPVALPLGSPVVCAGTRLAAGGDGATVVEIEGPVAGTCGATDRGDGRRLTLALWRSTPGEVGVVTPPPGSVPPGLYRLRATVGGIPSEAKLVRLP